MYIPTAAPTWTAGSSFPDVSDFNPEHHAPGPYPDTLFHIPDLNVCVAFLLEYYWIDPETPQATRVDFWDLDRDNPAEPYENWTHIQTTIPKHKQILFALGQDPNDPDWSRYIPYDDGGPILWWLCYMDGGPIPNQSGKNPLPPALYTGLSLLGSLCFVASMLVGGGGKIEGGKHGN